MSILLMGDTKLSDASSYTFFTAEGVRTLGNLTNNCCKGWTLFDS